MIAEWHFEVGNNRVQLKFREATVAHRSLPSDAHPGKPGKTGDQIDRSPRIELEDEQTNEQ